MATVNVSRENFDLGLYLQVVSQGAVYNNLSTEFPTWKAFQAQFKKGAVAGGEVRWNVRTAYGDGSFQFVDVNGGAFPSEQKSEMSEPKGFYKRFATTIAVPLHTIQLAQSKGARYAEPIAAETEAKFYATRRQLSASLHRDGTGVIGEISSVTTSSNSIVVTLKSTDSARSFIGWIQLGDKLKASRENTGEEAATINGGTAVSYIKVVSVDRDNHKFTADCYSAADVKINASSLSSTDFQADDYIRRFGENYVNIGSVSGDYNIQSYEWPGLESLSATDGRTVNNMVMSGALAGTHYDCGGDIVTFQDMQKAMSKLKVRVGPNRYKYDTALMAPETYDAMVESHQTDRRFTTVTDTKTGVASLAYVHQNDTLKFEVDEFVKNNRIWVLPKGDALCYQGSNIDYVKAANGGPWHLKPNSSGYDQEQLAYLAGVGFAYAQHPAAILRIHNFTQS